MSKRRPATARKPSPKKKTNSSSKKGGSSIGRFTLGVFILTLLAYGALALRDRQIVPKVFQEFELNTTKIDSPKEEGKKSTVVKADSKKEEELKVEVQADPEEESIDFEDFDLYFTAAFDFMWPAYSTTDAIIERPYYTIRYSEEHEQAMWVAYKLVADSLAQPTYERKDDFREDPRVRTGSATLADYKGSGYDRGHLAPAADFSYDEFALSQSFYMSNMSPQEPNFNRGVWKKLEDQVRDWAKANQAVYVVTGPVLNKSFKTIGKNKISVPEYYYKIVLDIEKPEIKAIAFLMKNEKSSAELSSFVVSIDQIENLTKLDFFPSLPDDFESALESQKAPYLWFK